MKSFAEAGAPTHSNTSYYWSDSLRPRRIIVIGDMQRTWLFERLFMGRKQNDHVRHALVSAVLDEQPDMVLLLGDHVSAGEYSCTWRRFDYVMAPINDAGIPVYGLIGNHDYGLFRKKGLEHLRSRFPYCTESPRTVRLGGGLALVTFDSNLSRYTPAAIIQKVERYTATLAELDADPTVTGVIVAAHHPPFTNSMFGHDKVLARHFAEPFLRARKTATFFAGHVHSYERFAMQGKTFVVSGGGGASREHINRRRPTFTDYCDHSSMRPHHYIRLETLETTLHAETMMLGNGGYTAGDSFSFPLHTAPQSAQHRTERVQTPADAALYMAMAEVRK